MYLHFGTVDPAALYRRASATSSRSLKKMANHCFFPALGLLGCLLFAECAVFINQEEASTVLHRHRRFNTGRLEEVLQGSLERECMEEVCSYEEAREVFENDEKTMAFWTVYIDGDQCESNPCKNGGRCKDDTNDYVCWCPGGYEGKNCELDATCSTKNGGCKQFCKDDEAGKAVCSCVTGYKLKEDLKTCEPTVTFPCGKIQAAEALTKFTRSSPSNTWNSLNETADNWEEGYNSTRVSLRLGHRIRVVGGMESKKGEVPWQVYVLNSEQKGFCGGTIINEKWVVTAAHCLEFQPQTIVAGEHNVNAVDNTEQYRNVARAIPHPTYNVTNKYHNDIALLELDAPLEFNHYVIPICLGDREFTNNLLKFGLGTVSGWGKLAFQGREASILQVLHIRFIDRPTCLRSSSYPIMQNMFCAGIPDEAKDTCQGDSGGPYTTDIDHVWFLTGITSWGEQCAKKDKFGIYTRVSRYVKWIRETTRPT
ncbi:coagulation factor IX-like [Candoia aspera]|uniref:coagulation factor IX-like n=1 Tax=Candoia aspera TaxID=51853 RepID=UPI002FD7B4C0